MAVGYGERGFHVFTLRKLGERLATLTPGHRHTEEPLGPRGAPPGRSFLILYFSSKYATARYFGP